MIYFRILKNYAKITKGKKYQIVVAIGKDLNQIMKEDVEKIILQFTS